LSGGQNQFEILFFIKLNTEEKRNNSEKSEISFSFASINKSEIEIPKSEISGYLRPV
jgi:hypothetical protein